MTQTNSKGEQVARDMFKMLNVMGGRNSQDFIATMGREHRTIQQNFTKLCFAWIKDLSEREHWDARNEASVRFAKSVMKNVPEDDQRFPFI